MLIPDIPKEPNLALGHKHGHTKRMNRRITEPLIIKPAPPIQPLEILFIRLTPKKAQITDLEIAKELAVVVVTAVVLVQKPVEIRLGVYEFRVRVDEAHGPAPEARETARVVEDVHGEAVLDVVVAHEAEDVVVDVAEVVHVGLDAPVEVEFEEARVPVEETGVPAAHVSVGDHPAFADADGAEVFEGVHEAAFVDPVGEGPVFEGDDFVVAFCGGDVLGCCLWCVSSWLIVVLVKCGKEALP